MAYHRRRVLVMLKYDTRFCYCCVGLNGNIILDLGMYQLLLQTLNIKQCEEKNLTDVTGIFSFFQWFEVNDYLHQPYQD